MEIFFSAGEPSGDQHAAHLIEELNRRRPGIVCTGYGGPRMERAGCRLHFQLTDLAVMFVWSVVPLLATFLRLVRRAGRYFRRERPDAVVLVDFPGFNWWIARQAKAAGVPVFYYLPPQLWAWAPWRIGKVRRFVDHVLCGLPFEAQWYQERGIDAAYVGHPFFDEIAAHRLDLPFIEEARTHHSPGRIVGLLPGSRDKEVARNWPLMIEVVKKLSARHPDVRFLVACFSERHRQLCLEMLADERATGRKRGQTPFHGESARFDPFAGREIGSDPFFPSVEFHVGKTPEIIEAADCCLMVSGSVSLEMLARGTPAVVVYRITRLTNLLGRIFLTCRYITLPNLMAGRELMPEHVVCRRPRTAAGALTAELDRWLSDPAELARVRRELATLRDEVVRPGATARTAEAILSRLEAAPGRARKAA